MRAAGLAFALALLAWPALATGTEPSFNLMRADGTVASSAAAGDAYQTCIEASKEPGAFDDFVGKGKDEQMMRDMLSPAGWRIPMKQLAAVSAMMARTFDCLAARGYPIIVGR